ncbi:cilia- and flagella-associated protein 70 [Aphidius gifuensis]|uniref:cilia- and flagella-associated protein 70 n=1 Tax=Aphidius gifuensis TaxID=684658 RepID=UPI001CDC377C|nr:cilia- and flagella-associated protein 70 [Aphidius gifuensis]
MHEALNSSFDGEIVFKKNKYHFKINSWYILEESYELGNLKVARNHYLELIGKNKKDPDAWLKYGIYLKKINDPERSLECCLESISLQNRHNLSLIYYGVLLMENDKHDEAEFFLKACVNFYPLKFENWMILYLFYAKINLSPEIDVTLKNAKDCIADENYKKMIFDDVIDEPFAWSTFQHHQQDQIHITITIFLLKLNLFMLADFALLKYLEQFGESISWIYFSAVSFYLQGKYSEALEKLQEAIIKHGKDYSIMSLMGHCLFKKNNLHEAIECYEFCNFIFDRPDDMHLVNLRLANCYVEFEQYKKAKKKFFDICKLTPTSASWLGLGSSCYHLGELIESEICLVEANLIDNCNPEIWGYLTLINISLDNYHEFLQCYRQTIKVKME